jgi:hypothetical protein
MTSPISVGIYPLTIAPGDFNQDGRVDLAIANYWGNNVTVLLGHGDGTFSEAGNSPIAVGSYPTGIVAGDFNNDGKQDLAVANSEYTSTNSSDVQVLLGAGDGTFTSTSANLPTGNNPRSIALGDFNRDGKVDLAVSNDGDDSVTFLLGANNGTFSEASASPVRVGNFPDSSAVADFNGDGLPDIAVTNEGPSTTSVLLSQLTETATATAAHVSPATVGTHQVEAAYSGDASYAASNSSTVALQGVANLPSL